MAEGVHKNTDGAHWEVPYLPIDPMDIKRGFEKVVRINSQSGKGGAAFIVKEFLGIELDEKNKKEFGKVVKKQSDKEKKELDPAQIVALYRIYASENLSAL